MKQNLRVFVVDDIPMIAYTLSEVLRDCGYSVTPYTDPVRALRDAQSLSPDVLISDVEMPALSGVDLAVQLQVLCPGCRVLLMSGHIGPIDRLESARTRGFLFPLFAKPVSAQTFAEQLEALSVATQSQSPHGIVDGLSFGYKGENTGSLETSRSKSPTKVPSKFDGETWPS